MSDAFDTDSNFVFLTVTIVVKNHELLSKADKKLFVASESGETDFPLNNTVTSIILHQTP